ncbi:MAG: hypothetical protein E6J41_29490 [Chloroflexi bacterium]|nr:MAG: hypothetical protein E6J41_29490 [Chloroflexota bacterium]
MLFHSLYSPDSRLYLVQTLVELSGPFDEAAFAEAWRQVARRHPALRTAFVWEGIDRPVQVVYDAVDTPVVTEDWRDAAPDGQRKRMARFFAADRERGLDLQVAPLMRVTAIRVGEDRWSCVWTHHHLVVDGWSENVVLREVRELHEALRTGRSADLPETRPFADYLQWLQARDGEGEREFWRRRLAGFPAATPIAADRRASGPARREAIRTLHLSPAEAADLREFARRHRLTTSSVLQAVWALLLGRWSGEEDVVFGATVAGRPAELPGIERMVGAFVNTLPVRVALGPGATVLELLRAVQAESVELREHEHVSLSRIREWSELAPGQPLFESIVIVESHPALGLEAPADGGLRLDKRGADLDMGSPLVFLVRPRGEALGLSLLSDPRCFEPATIERMAGQVRPLLAAVLASPDQRLEDLWPGPDAGQAELLSAWNRTARRFSERDGWVHEWLGARAAAQPDGEAVAAGDGRLTYRELYERASRLANHLRRRGAGPETRIGICMERSADLLVAVYGVLLCGAAYVPLDPAHPAERLAFLHRDSGAALVLTTSRLLERLPEAARTAARASRSVPATSPT